MKSSLGKSFTGSDIPGPGTYNYKNNIGSEGVKSTMSGHRDNRAVTASQNVPGPGAYNASPLRSSAPAFKYIYLFANY